MSFKTPARCSFSFFEALREAGAELAYVGDLKQAIYGFRTADSALFSALLDHRREAGGAPEELDRSRRSRPELVEFSNALFGAAMPHGLAFAPLTAENHYSQGAIEKATPSVEVVLHPRPDRHDPRLQAGVGLGWW